MPILRPFAVLLLTFMLAGASQRQTKQPPAQQEEPQQPPTFRATVNVVVAPTTVTDRDGSYISGLQPRDFRLTDNGKLQEIKVSSEYTPISLVIAIQANAHAEMALDSIRKIGPLLKPLVVGDAGEVALIAFDHRIRVLQDFSSDTDQLEAALKQLKPGSSQSRLTDAVVDSARMLAKRPPNRRRILLLITETQDIGSEAKTRQALTDLQFDNVVVYSVDMSRFVNTLAAKPQPPRQDPYPPGGRPTIPGTPITPSYSSQTYGNAMNSGNFIPLFVEIFKATKAIFVDNPVEVYTKWTGGREHSFVKQRDLEAAIDKIGTELHAQYVITYQPNNRDEGGFHDIVVSIPERPHAKIRTRPGYWVAAQPGQ